MCIHIHTQIKIERVGEIKERVESKRYIFRNQKKIYIIKHMLHKSVIFIECRLNI